MLLVVEGLRKSYGGVRAVRNVSFEVGAGEMVALIGPNGAGKSTCFGMVGGQVRPDGGRVRLEGRDITGAGPRRVSRLGVGRTFQVASVFGSMTVRENVQTAMLAARRRMARFWRAARSASPARADVLLERVGLIAQADRGAAVLAYGDAKRLELAMALANRPALLLMDEPTAGMAQAEARALMALVRALSRGSGLGVLYTEHDMDAVFGVADRILVLHRGRLIAEGDAVAISGNAEVRDVYLGAA